MSGARGNGAIDTMTKEENALLESMRNDTDAPETEVVQADAPEADVEIDVEDAPEASETPEIEQVEEGDPKPKKQVEGRISALTKQRKELEAQLATEREGRQKDAVERARLEERTRMIAEAVQAATTQPPAAPAPVELPDINTDPIGHFKALDAIRVQEANELKAIIHGFGEQQRQQQEGLQLVNWAKSQERDFGAREPGYLPSTDFLMKNRHDELTSIGITDFDKRQEIISNDLLDIARRSRADGVNFGERLYNLALGRGFKKPEPEAPKVPEIPPLDAKSDVLPDRAARAEQGRDNSVTIGGMGAPAPRTLTPQQIVDMPEAQFSKLMDSLKAKGPNAIRDLMGH